MVSRRIVIASLMSSAATGACGTTGAPSAALPRATPAPSPVSANSSESAVARTPLPLADPKEVVVFAASSLTIVFDQLWSTFKAQRGNGGLALTTNYGASSQLRAQLQEGASADVFASADTAQMELAAKAGLIDGESRIFARNRLVVIVPRANPGKVRSVADLGRPGLKFVTAPADVPIGGYTRTALKKLASHTANGEGFEAKVLANVVSEEVNVRHVVAKVQLGEADAGICYATDVTTVPAGDVTSIDIPDEANVVAEYPIAVLKSARNAATARQLIAFIVSPSGQAVLEAAKFKPA